MTDFYPQASRFLCFPVSASGTSGRYGSRPAICCPPWARARIEVVIEAKIQRGVIADLMIFVPRSFFLADDQALPPVRPF